MANGKLILSLEDYERFLHSPNDVDFSHAQLNQIIYMHGFRKISKRDENAVLVLESLSEINLTKTHRSTLQNNNNPNRELISLKEVKDDVEALNWQECHLHSIVTVGSMETELCNLVKRSSKRKKGEMTSSGIVSNEVSPDVETCRPEN